jgi:hypothetical protein
MTTYTNAAINKRYVVTKTTTYTATILDDIILADTSGGAFTITLPTAASLTGKELTIKKITSDTNAVTIDGNGSELIDESDTFTLPRFNNFVKVVSNGVKWVILNGITKWVKKALGTSISTNTTDIADFRLSNLGVGHTYRLSMNPTLTTEAGNGSAALDAIVDGSIFMKVGVSGNNGIYLRNSVAKSKIFVASHGSITFNYTQVGGSSIYGTSSGIEYSFIMLEELPQHIETTDFD